MTGRRVVAVIAGLGLGLGLGLGCARAQTVDADYDIDSDRWNGLSTLTRIAEGTGLRVIQAEIADWEELDEHDIVVILYPIQRLNPSHLAAFVREGGRVLLADDFGDSGEALARLGILREDGVGVEALRFHDEHRWAPFARPWAGSHPLAQGVDEIATNHPSILTSVEGFSSVFGFGQGEAVVVAGPLGDGEIVIVSDPSIFINRMLQFSGNFQFTINALRHLSRRQGTERVVVLAGDFALHGKPTDSVEDDSMAGTLKGLLKDFDDWLNEMDEYVLTQTSLRVLAIAFGLVVAVLAAGTLPLTRKTPLDGTWIRAGGEPGAIASHEAMVAHFDGADGGRRNFALPGSVLRDSINARLGSVLDHPDPLYGLREADVFARLRERRGEAAVAALRAIYGVLRALPPRSQVVLPQSSATLSRRDFERLHTSAEQLYRSLGED